MWWRNGKNGKSEAVAKKGPPAPPGSVDLALRKLQTATGDLKEQARDFRSRSELPVTPIEVPTTRLIEQARKIIAKHGCGACEECLLMLRMLEGRA